MENVLLVVSLLACIALIVAVLLQRSEGGALGMGGGGGGGLISGRGAADTLVHATMVLAAVFFVSCLALTRIAADRSRDSSEVIRTLEDDGAPDLSDFAAPDEVVDDVLPGDLLDEPLGGAGGAPVSDGANESLQAAEPSEAQEPEAAETPASDAQ